MNFLHNKKFFKAKISRDSKGEKSQGTSKNDHYREKQKNNKS